MQIKILCPIVSVIALISSSPANAFFGNECKKPKASYEQQLASAKKLKKDAYNFTPQEKATYYLETRKKAEKSISECLKKKLLTRTECKAVYNLLDRYPGDAGLVHYDILAKSDIAFNTAYRIVLNNQKCFDPVLVVEAQRALGK